MHKARSWLVLLFILCLTVGLCAVSVSADDPDTVLDSGSCGAGASWTVYADGRLVITGSGTVQTGGTVGPWQSLSPTSLTVEEGVTALGAYAFSYCYDLASVSLPDSLQTIGSYAFRACSGLTEIGIPENVTYIGDYAFDGCTVLPEISIPRTVTYIGEKAFRDCVNLSSVTLEGPVIDPEYGRDLFTESGVTSIALPEGLTAVPGFCFDRCTQLSSVTLPESLESIGRYAFYGCTSLTELAVPDGVTAIEYYAFGNCSALATVSIGPDSSLTTIGENAFRDSGLTGFTVPSDLTAIGTLAFSGCGGLTGFTVAADNASFSGGDGLLWSKDGTTLLLFPAGRTGAYCIPSGITVADYAFYGCVGLGSVSFSAGTTAVPNSMFAHCTGLTSVVFPEGLTRIGEAAFLDCASLSSLSLPQSLQRIENMAFQGCSALTELTVPVNVTSLGKGTEYDAYYRSYTVDTGSFMNCTSLETVNILGPVSQIPNDTFRGCTSLREIRLPGTVKAIGYNSYHTEALRKYNNDVPLQGFAFEGCIQLADIWYGGSSHGWDTVPMHGFGPLAEAEKHFAYEFAITAQPEALPVQMNASFSFSVTALGGSEGLDYCWQRSFGDGGWADIEGFSGHVASGGAVTLAASVTPESAAAAYRCVVTDQTGDSIISDSVTVDLVPALTVTTAPESLDIVAAVGDSISMSVEATGLSLTYQWQYRYDYWTSSWWNLTDGAESEYDFCYALRGANTAAYSGTLSNDTYNIILRCKIGDCRTPYNGQYIYSDEISLRILPEITTQPVDCGVPVGGRAAFWVENYGTRTSYQWYYRTDENGAWKPVSAASGKTPYYFLTAAQRHDGYQYYCNVTSELGSVDSDIATLYIVTAPVILSSPADASVPIGGQAVFTVEAEGRDLHYQWYSRYKGESFAWQPVPNNDAATLRVTVDEYVRNGMEYYCVVSNVAGSAESAAADLEALGLEVVSQPADTTVFAGKTAKFTITVAGEGYTYQWYYMKPGTNVAVAVSKNGSSSTYSLTTEERHNGYRYFCRFSNGLASASSDVATLTVLSAPKITLQPADTFVTVGETATIFLEAEGASLTYQWYYRSSADGEWTKVKTGGKTASYSLVTKERHNGYQYKCVVTNGAGSKTSSAVTLAVLPETSGDTLGIVTQPMDRAVFIGETAKFTVEAEGTGLRYQWYVKKTADGDWAPVSADIAKTAAYSLTAEARHDGFQYYCEVTDGRDTVTTEIVTLTVYAAPKITLQPADTFVTVGETATIFLEAQGEGLSYQWYYRSSAEGDWTAVSTGGKAASYSLVTKERHNGYQYRCKVTNASGSKTSDIVTLAVLPETAGGDLAIVTQPTDKAVYIGKNAKFTVEAEGTGLRYQWYVKKTADGDWAPVSADIAKTAAYSLTAESRHNGYQYYCEVTDGANTVTSEIVTLTVYAAPKITTQPVNTSVTVGETATIFLEVQGEGLSYQWYYRANASGDWTAVSTGGKAASYSLVTKDRHNGYQYKCVVTNGSGSKTSDIVTLAVLPATAGDTLGIVTQPTDKGVYIGKTAKFTVEAEGSNLSYQWYVKKTADGDWTPVSADVAKTASYSLTAESRHNGYQYYCEVTDGTSTVTTNIVTLTVYPAPKITTQPENKTVSEGKTVTFTVKAEGKGLSYQWYVKKPGSSSWTAVTAASGKTAKYSFTAAAKHNGYQYKCVVTNASGSKTSASVTLTVK